MPNKPTKPAKKAKAEKPAAPSAPKSRTRDVLTRLLANATPLSAAQRSAFASRFTLAASEAIGGRTKSEGVLRDAVDWAGVMAKALKKNPQVLRRYGTARFTWFLECIAALEDARDAQKAAGGGAGGASSRRERARRDALAARRELLETLDALVEGNEDAVAALHEAIGSTDTDDAIVASNRALAAVARGWLDRTDAASKALVASVGLDRAEADAASSAADALTSAASDKTIEGRVIVTDAPEVNRAEGRVLLEMRAAARLFAQAHERDRDVPKLVPGKATRGVIGPKPGKSKGDSKGDEPAAPPAASDAGTTSDT